MGLCWDFVLDFAGIFLGIYWDFVCLYWRISWEFIEFVWDFAGIFFGGILLEFSWDLFVCSAGPRASPIYTWRAQRLYMAGGHPLHIYKYFNKKCTHICTELPKYICRQKYLYNIPYSIASAKSLYKHLCRNICTKNKHVYNHLYTIFRLYKQNVQRLLSKYM